MKKTILTLLLCLSELGITHAKDHDVYLSEPSYTLVRDAWFSQNLDFHSMPENKEIYLTYWHKNPTAELDYDDQKLVVSGETGNKQHINFHYQNKVKTITFYLQHEPVRFNKAYIKKHNQLVSVEIPEVYELANILLALSDKFHHSNFRMHTKGDYYEHAMKWFAPFKDHKIFELIKEVSYYSLVENGPAYLFEENNIIASPVFAGFRARDSIKKYINLLNDFVIKSNFRAFYAQQKPYYQSLIDSFHSGAKPQQIWLWLEKHFPAKYQSYKVYFSPLGPGNNSARMYNNQNFKQTVMFISAPNRYDEESLKELKFMRTFFTEIDHAYVNPVSDQYVEEINQAFNSLKPWYKGGGYNLPYLTFNEYMTWGIVSLYMKEHYPRNEFLELKSYLEQFMVERRGFYQFKAFNNELIRLYEAKTDQQTITDLYPAIIAWISKQQGV